jgi:hypothetical protein
MDQIFLQISYINIFLEREDVYPYRSINDNYIFEPTIDGHRLILSHINGTTRLYTAS